MHCLAALVSLLAANLLAAPAPAPAPAPTPAPGPLPVASPQFFWPWGPFQPFYQVVAPRSLIQYIPSVALIADPDPSIHSQSFGKPEQKSAHGRGKRSLESELISIHDGGADTESENETVKKRQATYIPSFQMPWMPILSLPLSYAWSTQSFASPAASSAWSVVTL